jgi:hypothetical protein
VPPNSTFLSDSATNVFSAYYLRHFSACFSACRDDLPASYEDKLKNEGAEKTVCPTRQILCAMAYGWPMMRRVAVPAQLGFVDTIAVKLIAAFRAAAHRGRARIRPAAGLPAARDERAPEPRVSDRRASNTWCAAACQSFCLHSIAGGRNSIISPLCPVRTHPSRPHTLPTALAAPKYSCLE